MDNLGIEVDKYYACEIDSDTVHVVAAKCGTKVHQLGNIEEMSKRLHVHVLYAITSQAVLSHH